jgi:hypothetical protein
MKTLTEAALWYLERREATNAAMLKSREASRAKSIDADWLDAVAGDTAEEEETARRALGDAIIRADPQMQERVRKVVWYSAGVRRGEQP